MAKKKLDIFLGMDNAELKTKLNESTNMLKAFQTTIGGVLGGAALGISLKSIGDFALEAGKNFEKAAVSFKVFLGSEKEAQKMLNDIEEFASATPLTSSGLQENAKMLLQFNAVARDEVIPTLKMLGDVSGGDQNKLDSLTFAFSKAMSTGKLTSKVFNQLVIAGFNPLTVLAEKTGKSMAQLQEDMSKGKISAQMLQQAFQMATSEGGRFYNLLKEQSETKAGLESTKADNIEILARTISDFAIPALKEFDKAQIEFIKNTTANVKQLKEWAEVNNQTVNVITNSALALATAVMGYQSLYMIVTTVSNAHLAAVKAVNAEKDAEIALSYAKKVLAAEEVGLYQATLAYNAAVATGNNQAIKAAASDLKQATAAHTAATAQVEKATATAAATKATALQIAMTGNLSQALKVATAEVRAFTVALLANPWTWVAVAIAGVTAAFFALKNSAESTHKALEDLNNQQDQNVRKTSDAVKALKELDGAQHLNYEQTKRLDDAIAYLTAKYPKYIDKLREELRLKGEISRATAEQIANEMTLARVKGLQEQRVKLNKDMQRDMAISKVVGKYKAGGRYGISKANQKRDDELLRAEQNIEKERQAIINELTGQSATTTTSKGGYSSGGVSSSSSSKKGGKKDNTAEKERKEALALRLAQLDAELLMVKGNAEEEYRIELEKINSKLAQEKAGTAAYQQILNERTKLEQEHAQEVAEIELTALKNSNKIVELNLNRDKELLEAQKNNRTISNKEYYAKLKNYEEQKYNLTLSELRKEEELHKNNLTKLREIEQQKLELKINHDIELQKINTDSAKAEYETWHEAFTNIGDSFRDNLSDLLQGNKRLKDSFKGLFSDIAASFAKMIAKMLLEAAKLKTIEAIKGISGNSGFWGMAATGIRKLFGFASGGIIPGQYTQPTPIMAHGSEMVLNPLQQKNLWNMIAGGQQQTAINQPAMTSGGQPVIVNNITPIFQSLDPAQGQNLFNSWMKQSGIPIVRDSIKNNNNQMRDIIKGV